MNLGEKNHEVVPNQCAKFLNVYHTDLGAAKDTRARRKR